MAIRMKIKRVKKDERVNMIFNGFYTRNSIEDRKHRFVKKIRMVGINETLRRLKTGKTVLLEFWKCLGDEYRIVKKACQ